MANWTRFIPPRNESGNRGRRPMVARIDAGTNPKRPRLYIGKALRTAGVKRDAKYALLFDREQSLLGLREDADGHPMQGQTPYICISSFAKWAEISSDHLIDRFWVEDGVFVLPLTNEVAE